MNIYCLITSVQWSQGSQNVVHRLIATLWNIKHQKYHEIYTSHLNLSISTHSITAPASILLTYIYQVSNGSLSKSTGCKAIRNIPRVIAGIMLSLQCLCCIWVDISSEIKKPRQKKRVTLRRKATFRKNRSALSLWSHWEHMNWFASSANRWIHSRYEINHIILWQVLKGL